MDRFQCFFSEEGYLILFIDFIYLLAGMDIWTFDYFTYLKIVAVYFVISIKNISLEYKCSMQ